MTHIVPSPTWTKSSYSGGEGNECVEVALHGMTTAIRDSKAPMRGALSVPRTAFEAFIEGLKR
ncbi:DUF397 domain-containing protein [Streptomyces sp. NPDC046942]|uniref:DUF397 domain-containing protein n=1 Tax=Streptomyces sp. NPDC046942 TaxID=3155137 RepID=UPI0033DCB449